MCFAAVNKARLAVVKMTSMLLPEKNGKKEFVLASYYAKSTWNGLSAMQRERERERERVISTYNNLSVEQKAEIDNAANVPGTATNFSAPRSPNTILATHSTGAAADIPIYA